MGSDFQINIETKEGKGILETQLGKLLSYGFSIGNLKYNGHTKTHLEFTFFEHDDMTELLQALLEMFEYRKNEDFEIFDIDGLEGFIHYLKPSEQRKLRRLLTPKKNPEHL